jgi:hypothetical protein
MEEFLKWFGFWGTLIGLILGVIGMYFSWNAWHESKQTQKLFEREKDRLNEKIKIVLVEGKSRYELPEIRRQDVTRSEVQGRLRLVPTIDGSPYKIANLNENGFFKQIDKIVEGSNKTGYSTLTIECKNGEFHQFKFNSPEIKPEKEVKNVTRKRRK